VLQKVENSRFDFLTIGKEKDFFYWQGFLFEMSNK
jgi:hypothetical protein